MAGLTGVGLLLCRCGDPQGEHLWERAHGLTVCRRAGCRCVRFTEAPFADQQVPLFEDEDAGRVVRYV